MTQGVEAAVNELDRARRRGWSRFYETRRAAWQAHALLLLAAEARNPRSVVRDARLALQGSALKGLSEAEAAEYFDLESQIKDDASRVTSGLGWPAGHGRCV